MNDQIGNEINNNLQKPSIVDRVSNDLIFFGFALPSCKSEHEKKWLIQIYVKGSDGIERTGFANGKRDFNQAWEDRYDLEYKITEHFEEPIEF